jgi:hypothetical protein
VSGTFLNGCIKTATYTLNVGSKPILTFFNNKVPACYGDTITLVVGGASTFTWSTGATTPSINIQVFNSGSYNATATAINGCTNSGGINATVLPDFTISATSSQYTICAGESITLTATGAPGFTWSTGAQTPTISVTPSVSVIYTLSGAVNGCRKTTMLNQVVATCDGVEDLKSTSFCVFPNPVSDQLHVKTSSPGTITIYDQLGQVIIKEYVFTESAISCHLLQTGCYFYTFTSSLFLLNGKIVVQ